MTQRFKTAARMILAGLGCLVIVVIGFAVHVVVPGVIFLVLMVACGVALAASGYGKTKTEVGSPPRLLTPAPRTRRPG
jgi:hypothetical protein